MEQWIYMTIIPALCTLFFGGFAGHYYSQRQLEKRNRKQSVKSKLSLHHWIIDKENFKITLEKDGTVFPFKQLYFCDIELINIGNKAIPNFDLLINIPPEFKIIECVTKYQKKRKIQSTFRDNKADLMIEPYNREDKVFLEMYVTSDQLEKELFIENIELHTNCEIKFDFVSPGEEEFDIVSNKFLLVLVISMIITAFVVAFIPFHLANWIRVLLSFVSIIVILILCSLFGFWRGYLKPFFPEFYEIWED